MKMAAMEGTGRQALRAAETLLQVSILSSISRKNNRKTIERTTATGGCKGIGKPTQSSHLDPGDGVGLGFYLSVCLVVDLAKL